MPEGRAIAAMSSFDRVEEAIGRSFAYLPDEAVTALGELVSPGNVAFLVVVVLLWAGAQLTPLGVAADVAVTVLGWWKLIGDGQQLVAATQAALHAEDQEGLDRAARLYAAALAVLAVDVGTGVVMGKAMRWLKERLPTPGQLRARARAVEGKPVEIASEAAGTRTVGGSRLVDEPGRPAQETGWGWEEPGRTAEGERPTEERPAEERPAEERPAEERPTEERPTEERPAEEPSTGRRVVETIQDVGRGVGARTAAVLAPSLGWALPIGLGVVLAAALVIALAATRRRSPVVVIPDKTRTG